MKLSAASLRTIVIALPLAPWKPPSRSTAVESRFSEAAKSFSYSAVLQPDGDP